MRTSRLVRQLQLRANRMAVKEDASTLVRDQKLEEQKVNDERVGYVESTLEPLEYIHEGEKHVVPALTDDGHNMTYHDQYYQITRMKNGLPIEAKRMIDYKFDIDAAADVEADDRDLTDPDWEHSDEYKNMKEQHHAQHPEDE